MSLNAYKNHTQDLCEEMGWGQVPLLQLWLFFTEEVGELASAIRQTTHLFRKSMRKNHGAFLEQEFGDVFSYLFQLAYMLDIDLDAMYWNHRARARTKIYPHSINDKSHMQRKSRKFRSCYVSERTDSGEENSEICH